MLLSKLNASAQPFDPTSHMNNINTRNDENQKTFTAKTVIHSQAGHTTEGQAALDIAHSINDSTLQCRGSHSDGPSSPARVVSKLSGDVGISNGPIIREEGAAAAGSYGTPNEDAAVDPAMSLSPEHIRLTQRKDDCIRTVMDLLNSHVEPPDWVELQKHNEETRILLTQWESLTVMNGIAYRRFLHADGSTKYLQILLPATLRKEFVARLHAETGHWGQTKTCSAVALRAYFPGWRSFTKLIVRNCMTCNLHQRSRQPPKQTPLRPMQEFRPMAVLHADLVGLLPDGQTWKGQRGYKYVLSVI